MGLCLRVFDHVSSPGPGQGGGFHARGGRCQRAGLRETKLESGEVGSQKDNGRGVFPLENTGKTREILVVVVFLGEKQGYSRVCIFVFVFGLCFLEFVLVFGAIF